MSIEFRGPLQGPLSDILPYLKEKLSAHLLKKVDVCVIGKVHSEPPLVDLLSTIETGELILMLRALANDLEKKR